MIQISYKKLWILLIEHDMKRTDLIRKAGISAASTLAKFGKNELVHMEVLLRICDSLSVNIGDIVDFGQEDEHVV